MTFAKGKGLTLETIALIVTELTDIKCSVRITWIDFGAGIKQEQIIVENAKYKTDRSWDYQLLNPRELQEIQNGVFTLNDVSEIVNAMTKRGWWLNLSLNKKKIEQLYEIMMRYPIDTERGILREDHYLTQQYSNWRDLSLRMEREGITSSVSSSNREAREDFSNMCKFNYILTEKEMEKLEREYNNR